MVTNRFAVALLVLVWSCTPKQGGGSDHGASRAPVAEPATPPSRAPGVRYRFALDASARRLSANVCFDGTVPERLSAPMSKAIPFLASVRYRDRALVVEDGVVALSALRPGDCLDYTVDVAALLRDGGAWDGVGRVGDDVLLSPDWWLWAPEPRPAGQPITARFDGPMKPAVPWPRGQGSYPFTIPASTFGWKAQGAFGHFQERRLTLGDAQLEIAELGEGFGEREAAVHAWLDRSAEAVAGLLGRFPVPRAQVLLVADPDRDRTFGYALRGGGPSTALLLPDRPSQASLDDDWTAVHELLHFSLPPLPTADAWLYEGLVTYLTAVARARAGIIAEEEGWWELLDGFERGRRVGTGVSLRKESEQMHDNHTYWRVYWSGAALMLQIDVELREHGTTLADVVSRLSADRPGDDHDWDAAEVVEHLNELCGSEIPARIVARHLDAEAFPDTRALRAQLGVHLAGETVRYDDRAPKAAIRRAIMRRR